VNVFYFFREKLFGKAKFMCKEKSMKFGKSLFLSVPLLVLGTLPLAAGGAQGGRVSGSGNTSAGGPTGKISYPIKTDVTLTFWTSLATNVQMNYTNIGDTPFGKGIQERTGIKVQFLHPPAGSDTEQYNLMVASGDLPDIINRGWSGGGGPEKAISDNIILRLNEVYEKYAPSLTAYFKARPDYERMAKTDNGSYFTFPFIRGDPGLLGGNGMIIRKDWLDEVGLAIPETVDEWYTVLKAFKEKKGSSAPFTFNYNRFIGSHFAFLRSYGVMGSFFIGNDGKVHYGPIEDGYRNFLTTFSRWYKEGIIDPDLPTIQEQQLASKMTGSVSGASFGTLQGNLGTWISSTVTTNPSAKFVAAPNPTIRKGEKSQCTWAINPIELSGSSITTACKNVDIAARFLDWAYSDEGYLFCNFGIEGVSYRMVNGSPVFTEIVMKNPQGMSLAVASAPYSRTADGWSYVQDIRSYSQLNVYPEQEDALKLWAPDPDTMFRNMLPPVTPTQEETQEYARIMSEISTYTSEMIVKFILGTENLSGWDNYVNNVKQMGIDRALAIQSAALTRYRAR
jgi:putative aldouronate transport system substrate-binding protein